MRNKPDQKKDNRTGSKGGERSFKKKTDGVERKSFGKGADGERKPFRKGGDKPFRSDKPYKKREGEERGEHKPFRKDGDKPYGTRATGGDGARKKPYGTRAEGVTEHKPFRKEGDRSFKSDRPYRKREGEDRDGHKPFRKDGDRPFKSDRPYKKREGEERGERKPFRKDGERPFKSDRPYKKPEGEERGERKPFRKDGDRPYRSAKSEGGERKPYNRKGGEESGAGPFKKPFSGKPAFKKVDDSFDKAFPLGSRKVSGPFRKKFLEEKEGKLPAAKPVSKKKADADEDKEMTLNKYIAHSGECSRRDAAELVKQGKVKINGELVLEPGYRVKPEDRVTIAGKKLTPQRSFVYVLLNKPKGFITTTEDPAERKTVMDLIDGVEAPRVYPVGRLDRNTTGLLLLTNDGDLAQKLSHPSYEVKKVYQVTLDKPLTKADFEKILEGLTLDDGEVKVDALSYLESKNELGIEIHSGRNRIVRRIFESLGYEVEKLDRVMYAGLTKKNIPRGKWRLLTDREIVLLKHFKV